MNFCVKSNGFGKGCGVTALSPSLVLSHNTHTCTHTGGHTCTHTHTGAHTHIKARDSGSYYAGRMSRAVRNGLDL